LTPVEPVGPPEAITVAVPVAESGKQSGPGMETQYVAVIVTVYWLGAV
jgi:hypothetical protein